MEEEGWEFLDQDEDVIAFMDRKTQSDRWTEVSIGSVLSFDSEFKQRDQMFTYSEITKAKPVFQRTQKKQYRLRKNKKAKQPVDKARPGSPRSSRVQQKQLPKRFKKSVQKHTCGQFRRR